MEKSHRPTKGGLRLSWKTLPFGGRLTLVGTVVAAAIIVVVSIANLVAYRADKLPYLFDLQLKKARVLEARLQAYMFKRGNAQVIPTKELDSPQDMFLPRLPMGDEVFVASIHGAPALLGRNSDETVWMRSVGDLSDFWESADDFSYIITASGLFVGTNREDLITAKSGLKRQGIDEFLRSGVASGTKLYRSKEQGERIVAHRSIPGSNVIIFCEVDVNAALQPMVRFFTYTIYGTIVSLWLVFVVVIYFMRVLMQPLHSIGHQLTSILRGEHPRDWPHEFSDEFLAISRGISMMHEALGKQTLQLENEQRARRTFIKLRRFLEAHPHKRESLVGLSQAISSGLSLPGSPSLTLYVFSGPEPTSLLTNRLWKIPLTLSGIVVSAPEGKWAIAEEWDTEILKNLCEKQYPVVLNELEILIPLAASTGTLGFLALSGVKTKGLTPAQMEWLAMIAQEKARSMETSPLLPSSVEDKPAA